MTKCKKCARRHEAEKVNYGSVSYGCDIGEELKLVRISEIKAEVLMKECLEEGCKSAKADSEKKRKLDKRYLEKQLENKKYEDMYELELKEKCLMKRIINYIRGAK